MARKQNQSVHRYVADMIHYLIDVKVRQPPYIVMVSKRQLWFGNGLWKGADPLLKKGLREYLGIKIPSNVEIERKELFYGYKALVPPWEYLNNITNHAIRQLILWEIIDDGIYSDIRPVLGKGYVRPDGKLDPKQTNGISCYVFFHNDHEYREEQNIWIGEQKDWVQLQILRNQLTHPKILEEKQQEASTLMKNNRKLLALVEYKELDVPIDREKISWAEDE